MLIKIGALCSLGVIVRQETVLSWKENSEGFLMRMI